MSATSLSDVSPDPAREWAAQSFAFATAALNRLLVNRTPDADAQRAAAAREAEQRALLRDAVAAHPALRELGTRLGLTSEVMDLVAVLYAAEVDERIHLLITRATGEPQRCRLEVGMLGELLALSVEVVAPGSALRRSALVVLGAQSTAARASVQLAPRFVWALCGDVEPDPALEGRWEFVSGGPTGSSGWLRVLVTGGDRIRRQQAALLNLAVPGCLTTTPPTTDSGWAALVREATLAGVGVLIETEAPLDPMGSRWVERATQLPVALSSSRALPLAELPACDWRELAGGTALPSGEEWSFTVGLEARHPLTASQLDLMRRALRVSGGDEDVAYRRLTDGRMEVLATKISPSAGWDDLVLSPGRKGQLRDLVNRYLHSGQVYDEWGMNPGTSRGVVALFSGPSGTGKTLSAEVVAGELGLDLFRLDLSSVVSKYIGETEKNLDELFDAAGIGNTVLFFDEADSLFGKRTEVTDARDRYANVETSYLLQRLERYDGMVVLATNYEKNIDQAFLRRVHSRIAFASPTAAERTELWRHNLDRDLVLAGDVDLEWLVASFELTGAAIRNAVVDAAFLAAAEDGPLAMGHLVRGVAREMGKLGRVINESQFGRWYDDAIAHTPSDATGFRISGA